MRRCTGAAGGPLAQHPPHQHSAVPAPQPVGREDPRGAARVGGDRAERGEGSWVGAAAQTAGRGLATKPAPA